MAGGSPPKGGFLQGWILRCFWRGLGWDLNGGNGGGIPGSFDPPAADWFDETSIPKMGRVRVPLSSASLKRGTDRPGSILTLAIAIA